jgi:hypothetical protein
VDQPLAQHPFAHLCLQEQIDGSLFQNAGTNAADNVLAAAALEHDIIDAVQLQQLREQQTGRSGADDCDLGSDAAKPSSAAAGLLHD